MDHIKNPLKNDKNPLKNTKFSPTFFPQKIQKAPKYCKKYPKHFVMFGAFLYFLREKTEGQFLNYLGTFCIFWGDFCIFRAKKAGGFLFYS
jgi:hypothetical protein